MYKICFGMKLVNHKKKEEKVHKILHEIISRVPKNASNWDQISTENNFKQNQIT